MMGKKVNHGLPGKYVSGKMALYRNGQIINFSTFRHKDDRVYKMAKWVQSIENINPIENEFTIIIRLDDYALPE